MSYITVQFRLLPVRMWIDKGFPSSCPVCASPLSNRDGFLICTWCDRIVKGAEFAILKMIAHQLAEMGI